MNKTLKIILLILVVFLLLNYSCKKIKEKFANQKSIKKKCKLLGRKYSKGKCTTNCLNKNFQYNKSKNKCIKKNNKKILKKYKKIVINSQQKWNKEIQKKANKGFYKIPEDTMLEIQSAFINNKFALINYGVIAIDMKSELINYSLIKNYGEIINDGKIINKHKIENFDIINNYFIIENRGFIYSAINSVIYNNHHIFSAEIINNVNNRAVIYTKNGGDDLTEKINDMEKKLNNYIKYFPIVEPGKKGPFNGPFIKLYSEYAPVIAYNKKLKTSYYQISPTR